MGDHDQPQSTRRAFLRGALVAGTSIGLLGAAKQALAAGPCAVRCRRRIPIAVQLYSVRDDCAKDLPGVLKAVSQMGYEGVEFAGYYGRSAKELRAMLDDNGLKVAGSHVGLESLLGDELQRSIEFHKTIGNEFLIVPGLGGQYTADKAAWEKTAGIFNEIAAKLQPLGMYTGYHNHTMEFQKFPDGTLPWDAFFGNTRQRVVMQFDTGNAMIGGAEALPFLEKYPGRALTVHMKEFSPTNGEALVGEGDIPWRDIIRVCRTTGGTEWFIVEQESYAYPPIECIRRCLANLRMLVSL